MKAMLGIGLVCSLAWSMHAQAASFNCDKAKTTPEHAICEYRQINDADVKMATTYTILKRLVPMGTRGMIQDEQVKWLSSVTAVVLHKVALWMCIKCASSS